MASSSERSFEDCYCLTDLPSEVLVTILEYLPLLDLSNVRLVSYAVQNCSPKFEFLLSLEKSSPLCIWACKRSADCKSFVHHRFLYSALIQVCSRLKKIVDNDYLWARASLDSTWVSAENWRIFQRCFMTSIIAFFVHNMRLFASSFAGLQTVGMWKLSPSWPLPTSTLREASLSYGCYSSERVQRKCKLDRWVWSMRSDFWCCGTSWTESGAPVPVFWPCAPLWDVNLHNCMWGSLEQHGKCEFSLCVRTL